VVALAVVGWIVTHSESEKLADAEPEPAVVAVPKTDALLGQVTVPDRATPVTTSVAETSSEILADAKSELEVDPATEFEQLSGTVALFNATGTALSEQSGVLTWVVWNGETSRRVKALVEKGKWKVDLPGFDDTSMLEVQSLLIGAEPFVVDMPAMRIPIPENRFIEVSAHRRSGTMLHVFDASTGYPLHELRLALGGAYEQHPGSGTESRLLARDQSSPIGLTQLFDRDTWQEIRQGRLFVAADGYAWAMVKVGADSGGTIQVALQPGGGLKVSVSNYDPKDACELRVRVGGKKWPLISQILRNDDPLQFTGLPVGGVRASVEIGSLYDGALTLGDASSSINAGEVTELMIEASPAPEPEYANASGLLLVHKSWGNNHPRLDMTLIGIALGDFDGDQSMAPQREPQADRPGFHAFRWTFDSVQIGGYELGITEPQISFRIDVPVGGRDNFVLEVPARVELLVRVVNNSTGEDILVDELYWTTKRPKGVNGSTPEDAKYVKQLQRYRIFAPETEISLRAWWNWTYKPLRTNLDLATGVREYTLRASSATVIAVTLMDGETPAALAQRWCGEPRALEGTEGRVELYDIRGPNCRFMVSAPGRDRIEFADIPGFQPIEPLIVDLPEGETIEKVVELHRL